MTDEQEQNLQEALEEFGKRGDKKYRVGQAEHKGNLWEVTGLLDEAMNEVIDQWFYLFNLKKQIQSIISNIERK